MDTERERERGEHWEDEGWFISFDIRDVIGFFINVKEKLKDIIYEITSDN